MERQIMTEQLARAQCAEDGFTLIEMIIAVLISTMIIGAMAAVFVTSARSTNSTAHRSSQANDAQVISGFLIRDAEAAGGINPQTGINDTDLGVFTNAPVATCTSGGAAISGTVLRFRWVDRTGANTHYDAIYWLSGNKLVRTLCTTPTATGITTSTDATLAKTVQSASTTCTTHTTTGTCNNGSNGQPQMPDSVHLLITATTNSNPVNGAIVGPYTYTLTASLRPQNGLAPSMANSAQAPLILLGSSPCGSGATGLNVNASGTLRVYGAAYVNTSNGSGCSAMSVTRGGTFQAGSTSILTGGSCATDLSGSVCPTTTPYSPALVDPYLGLARPPAGTARSNTCASGSSGTLQPGVYAANVHIASSTVCTMASGVYRFQNGLNVSNGGSLTSAAGGVLIYITGGQFIIQGAAAVTVTAQSTGPYAGLVIWQDASDTTTVAFNAGGALTLNGTLYAPKASVVMSGDAQNPFVGAVVAQFISILNSTGMKIGSPSATALSVTGPSSLQWTVGRAITPQTFTPHGGDGFYTWSATSLPAGIAMNPTTGTLTGSAAAGTYNITIMLNDALGDDPGTLPFTLKINAAPSITATPLPTGDTGIAYSTSLAGTGGTSPYSWSTTPGTLPPGLATSAGGTISGTPTTAGTTTFTVTLTDAAGATATNSFSITINPKIISLALSGGTAGKVEKGDTIVVVFSGPMSTSSFCTGWAGASLNAVVTLKDGGATNDSITLTATGCTTFNFDKIDLASTTYVTGGDATFSGGGGNASTITWNAATQTLTIKLGTKGGAGTVGVNQQSAPSYIASGSITDTAGRFLWNSPFTLPSGLQF